VERMRVEASGGRFVYWGIAVGNCSYGCALLSSVAVVTSDTS